MRNFTRCSIINQRLLSLLLKNEELKERGKVCIFRLWSMFTLLTRDRSWERSHKRTKFIGYIDVVFLDFNRRIQRTTTTKQPTGLNETKVGLWLLVAYYTRNKDSHINETFLSYKPFIYFSSFSSQTYFSVYVLHIRVSLEFEGVFFVLWQQKA